MVVDVAGTNLVKEFEGFPHGGRPYLDTIANPAKWTQGYGHVEGVSSRSPRWTEGHAAAVLQSDLDHHYAPYVSALKLPLNQSQFDALVSFVYNVGPGGISASTEVGRALRQHHWKTAADGLLAWSKAGGVTIPGLLRRRRAERAMFLKQAHPALDGYRTDEIAWIHEYDHLVRVHQNTPRQHKLQQYMFVRRQEIWHAANAKGSAGGWGHAHRRDRYRSLAARTSGLV